MSNKALFSFGRWAPKIRQDLIFDNSETQNELSSAILSLDEEWRISDVNSVLLRKFSVVQELIVGRLLNDFVPENRDRKVMERLVRELKSTGRIDDFDLILEFPGQAPRSVLLNAIAQFNSDGGIIGANLAIFDITKFTQNEAELLGKIENISAKLAEVQDYRLRLESQSRDFVEIAESVDISRQETQEALDRAEESEKRFRTIISSVADGILVVDPAGVIQVFNHAAEKIFATSVVECIGRDIKSLIVNDDGSLSQFLKSKVPGDQSYQKELTGQRKEGTEFPMELTANATSLDDTKMFVVICRDVSDRKRFEAELESLAKFDPLTGLANRTMFHEKLDDALRYAERGHCNVAVLYLDLDNFKNINDTLGHPAGDQLLKVVSQRLTKCIREVDTVARLGGDEFAIIATGIKEQQLVHRLANRVIEAMKEPVNINGHSIHTGTSIGITLFPNDAVDPDRLLKNADLALYRAKSNGRARFEFFHHDMNDQIVARMTLEGELRAALINNELSLYYQPQVEIASGAIVGAEALIRWRKENGAMVRPDEFIPVAENCGMMRDITGWVLKEAVRQCKEWQTAGLFSGRIGVNLSPTDLKYTDFAPSVIEILESSGLDPSMLELEITEGMMIEKLEAVTENLRKLRQSGIGLAIDDFGTGYSSLAYLGRLSIDRLKIDQTFVRDIITNKDDVAIIEAIISMSHALDLKVIAEGVETAAQFDLLRSRNCDEIQGYLIARPMPADDFIDFIREYGSKGDYQQKRLMA